MQSEVADIAVFRGAQQQLEDVPDVRDDRVSEARQRVESGFYDQAEVRLETADRILDEMA